MLNGRPVRWNSSNERRRLTRRRQPGEPLSNRRANALVILCDRKRRAAGRMYPKRANRNGGSKS